MRFLFVTSGSRAPSTRFRILPYVPAIEAAGHRCEVAHSFPEKYDYFKTIGWRLSQRLKRTVRHWHAFLASYRRYDAIIIEREVFDDDTSDMEQRFRAATSNLVLDVDDGIFLRHPHKFATICQLPNTIIAGNHWLAEHVATLLEPKALQPKIITIPTCIRLADYAPKPLQSQPSRPVIGWIGTPGNVAFLSVAAEGLRKTAKQLDYELLIVSSNLDSLPTQSLAGVNHTFRPWNPTREVADLHSMDIGLMPLPADDPWMKYKCGLKLIQYLAVGIPGIASPVGVNSDILAGQLSGRLAASPKEWELALTELISSAQLRQECGTAGRELVKAQFSIESQQAKLISILENNQLAPVKNP
jgi:glycosyltransferase involved in cell wall biosynthesis